MRSPLVLAAALCLATPALAAEHVLTLDPAHARVTFVLEATGHDVEGSFPLSKCEVHFDPEAGTASGEISLDAAQGVTGNPKRDKTMKEKVLLTPTAPSIVFHPARFRGILPETGAADVALTGSVSVAGLEQPLTLVAHVVRSAAGLHLQSTAPVPFVEWGLHDPSVLFMKVQKIVQLSIEGDASIDGAPVSSPPMPVVAAVH